MSRPKPLKLSVEITDNIGAPRESLEIENQNRRMATVLEVRYLDESLIPMDPDEVLSIYEAHDTSGTFERIPWVISGETAEDNDDDNVDVNLMGAVDSDVSLPSSLTSVASSSGAGSMPADFDINTFLNSLPYEIQTLDPGSIQLIVDDTSILEYIIRPDGSIDANNLTILTSSITAEEFRNNISLYGVDYVAIAASNAMTLGQDPGYGYGGDEMVNDGLGLDGGYGTGAGYGGGMSGIVGGMAWDQHNPLKSSNLGLSSSMLAHNSHTAGMDGAGNQWIGQSPGLKLSSRAHYNPGISPSMNSGAVIGNLSTLRSRLSASINSSSGSGNAASSFSSTVAAGSSNSRAGSSSKLVPCRFYNSDKGCSNGDRCKFGHFSDPNGGGGLGLGLSIGSGPGSGLSTIRGPGQRLSGPGSIRHSLSGSIGSSNDASKRGSSRPSKRPKH